MTPKQSDADGGSAAGPSTPVKQSQTPLNQGQARDAAGESVNQADSKALQGAFSAEPQQPTKPAEVRLCLRSQLWRCVDWTQTV